MGNTDTPPIFDSVAKGITKNIVNATSKEIALICRLTFKGIEDMLTGKLRDVPEKSVFAAEDALNKIDEEYTKLLRRKDGIEVEIWTEINDIEPELNEAISQITAAAVIRNRANPDYNSAVRKCRKHVAEINAKIARFDDIVIDRPDDIDSG